MKIKTDAFTKMICAPGTEIMGQSELRIHRPFYGYRYYSQFMAVTDDKQFTCTIQGYRSLEGRESIAQMTDNSIEVVLDRDLRSAEWMYPDGSRYVKKYAGHCTPQNGEPTQTTRLQKGATCWWVDHVRNIAVPYPTIYNGMLYDQSVYYKDWSDPSCLPESWTRIAEVRAGDVSDIDFDKSAKAVADALDMGNVFYSGLSEELRRAMASVGARLPILATEAFKTPWAVRKEMHSFTDDDLNLLPIELSMSSFTRPDREAHQEVHRRKASVLNQIMSTGITLDQPSPAACAALYATLCTTDALAAWRDDNPSLMSHELAVKYVGELQRKVLSSTVTKLSTHLIKKV